MPLPVQLPSLSTNDAIADPIYRCVVGIDTADAALFESAFTADAILDVDGTAVTGRPAIRTGCYDPIAGLDTTHHISNVRVNKLADDKASVTATALAQHFRAGEGKENGTTRLTSGSLYFADIVREGGEGGTWKISSCRFKLIWTEGDSDVMKSSQSGSTSVATQSV